MRKGDPENSCIGTGDEVGLGHEQGSGPGRGLWSGCGVGLAGLGEQLGVPCRPSMHGTPAGLFAGTSKARLVKGNPDRPLRNSLPS